MVRCSIRLDSHAGAAVGSEHRPRRAHDSPAFGLGAVLCPPTERVGRPRAGRACRDHRRCADHLFRRRPVIQQCQRPCAGERDRPSRLLRCRPSAAVARPRRRPAAAGTRGLGLGAADPSAALDAAAARSTCASRRAARRGRTRDAGRGRVARRGGRGRGCGHTRAVGARRLRARRRQRRHGRRRYRRAVPGAGGGRSGRCARGPLAGMARADSRCPLGAAAGRARGRLDRPLGGWQGGRSPGGRRGGRSACAGAPAARRRSRPPRRPTGGTGASRASCPRCRWRA